ncbi:MAG TPA: pilin [Actinokineospora sp.]|jgi:hypothetical protein|nr:pilin [Actinokineospora sp.]
MRLTTRPQPRPATTTRPISLPARLREQPAPARPARATASRIRSRFGPKQTRRVVVVAVSVAAGLLMASSAAHAETHVMALVTSIDEVLTNIRNWIMGILAAIATVFLSIGGVRYVMGSGDPGEIERAKSAFKASAVGYGLAAMAPLIVTVLKGIVGAT